MRLQPAFLFDLDGTRVDSVYQHVLAWKEALEAAGHHLPDEQSRLHDRGRDPRRPYNNVKHWDDAGLIDAFNAEDGKGIGLRATSGGEFARAIDVRWPCSAFSSGMTGHGAAAAVKPARAGLIRRRRSFPGLLRL